MGVKRRKKHRCTVPGVVERISVTYSEKAQDLAVVEAFLATLVLQRTERFTMVACRALLSCSVAALCLLPALCLPRRPRVVDVRPLHAPAATQEELALCTHAIDAALREDGLVIITGYENPTELQSRAFHAAYELFGLPGEAKANVNIKSSSSEFGRGYLGFGDESGVAAFFEPKEGYSYGSPYQGQ